MMAACKTASQALEEPRIFLSEKEGFRGHDGAGESGFCAKELQVVYRRGNLISGSPMQSTS